MVDNHEWIIQHGYKLCQTMQQKVQETYTHHKWLPRFLHKPIRYIKQTFIRHQVIIKLHDDYYYTMTAGEKKVLGCKVGHELKLVNGFSTKVSVRTLKKLMAHDKVAAIWHDREVKALLDVATPVVNAPQVWKSGGQGKGVGIAILDTGIYPHPDLTTPNKRIIAFKDFINNKKQPYDDNGHGTHCAGDAAGNGYVSGGKYQGPAPKANLIGVKVLDKKGKGTLSKVMVGIQWCIDNRRKLGIKVLSMSLGSPATQSYKDDPMCKAVRAAWKADLVVCVAAGNEGPKAGTINSPGTEPSVITVGAEDDRNTPRISDDPIAYFSSRGPTIDGLPKPDVVAPGVNIVSLRSPKSYLDSARSRVGTWYASFSGTSMATPICAGVVALLIERKPDITPVEVKSILTATGRNLGTSVNAQGEGLIDAEAAVKKV